MTSDKSGTEAESVPLGVHSVNDLVGVDVHTVKYHRKLVHKGDVYVTLAVFNNLYRFRRLDIGNGVSADLYNDIVYVFDLLGGLLVHSRDDFADIFKAVNLVAGIYSFGGIADLEILAAFKSRSLFKNRNTNVLGTAGINGRFKNYYRAFGKIASYDLRSTDNGGEIGSVIGVDGGGNGNNMKLCLL